MSRSNRTVEFGIYLNNEYKCDITASNKQSAAETYAEQNGIKGSWQMGSSRFVADNGDVITLKMV